MNVQSFSALMSVYSATRASDLERCLNSLSQQTLPASEIVLVQDGPIDSSVQRCIEDSESHLPIRHLIFRKNRGLGPALSDGLNICQHKLVARVDSDDWSIPERFQLQVEFLQKEPKVSVVGGWLKEWYLRGTEVTPTLRRCPSDSTSILNTAKRRNPINHPTVMFRKAHVLACGSYESCPLFEDYYLWAKMLSQGYRLCNIPTVLVETDVDWDYFSRRGGLNYIRNEILLIRKFIDIGFFSPFDTVRSIVTRLPFRLAPLRIRKYLYYYFLRARDLH